MQWQWPEQVSLAHLTPLWTQFLPLHVLHYTWHGAGIVPCTQGMSMYHPAKKEWKWAKLQPFREVLELKTFKKRKTIKKNAGKGSLVVLWFLHLATASHSKSRRTNLVMRERSGLLPFSVFFSLTHETQFQFGWFEETSCLHGEVRYILVAMMNAHIPQN